MISSLQSVSRKSLTIIGLGNEYLTDDGLGVRVVRDLKKRLDADEAKFEELSIGGIQLLDYLAAAEECIIVDAIVSGSRPAGTLYRFIQSAEREDVHITSSHQIDLSQVLAFGKLMGAQLPKRLTVYGIEADDVTTFNDGCSTQVMNAIPKLVNLICKDIENSEHSPSSSDGEWQILHEIVTN